MACKCKERTTIIQCTQCGKMQTVNHSKSEDPIVVAKRLGKRCRCFNDEFVVGEA